jgi:hypothetical protein
MLRVGNAYPFTDLDLATALRTFAHFEYKNHDCLDLLMRKSVKQASEMGMRSLAVVVSSFAQLDKADPVLMTITREAILKGSDFKAIQLGDPQQTEDLSPVDCT